MAYDDNVNKRGVLWNVGLVEKLRDSQEVRETKSRTRLRELRFL